MLVLLFLLTFLKLSAAGQLSDYLSTYLSNQLDWSIEPCTDFYSHVCPSDLDFGNVLTEWFEAAVEPYAPKAFDLFESHFEADVNNAEVISAHQPFLIDSNGDPITVPDVQSAIPVLRQFAAWHNFLKDGSTDFMNKQERVSEMFHDLKQTLLKKFLRSEWIQRADLGSRIKQLIHAIDLYDWVHSVNAVNTIDVMNEYYTNCTSSREFEDSNYGFGMCYMNAFKTALWTLTEFQLGNMEISSMNAFYSNRRIHILPVVYLLLPNTDEELDLQSKTDILSVFSFIVTHEVAHAVFENYQHFELEEFPEDAECVKDHMNKTCAQFGKGPCYNGPRTYGEDAADWAALETTFGIFKQMDRLSEHTTMDLPLNMTSDQYYFYSLAAVWCRENAGEHRMNMEGKPDVHSAPKVRWNGLFSQSNAFQEAFNCKAGDQMTTTQEEKCHLFGSMAQG